MANQSSSIINLPPTANLAPIKPFVDLKDPQKKDKDVATPLTDQIRKKYEEKIAENKEKWRSMIAIGQIIAFFIEGEQILEINSFTGMPRVAAANKNNPLHIKAINKMQGYSTIWQHKWSSSKPDILAQAFSNADQAVAQVKKVNAVCDYLESQWFTSDFDLNEGLNVQIWGWYGRKVRPDFGAKSFSMLKEVIEDVPTPIGKGFGKCACGYAGEKSKEVDQGGEKTHLCPECGKPLQYSPPIMQMLPKATGKEKVFLPEIICEPLLFPSCRWDLSRRASESDWFITERQVQESALRRLIKNIRIPEGESANKFGLDIIEQIATRGANNEGRASAPDKSMNAGNKITLTDMYLGADDLYDIEIGKGEKTASGETLPAGKRMSDVYPEGAYFFGTNGMTLTLGIYGLSHKDEITDGVYHKKPMSGAGRGVADAVPIQTQYNRRYSQYDRQMSSRATPPIMMVENAIEPRYRKMLSRPDAVIPIKLQNFPEVKSLQQLIAPLQSAAVDGSLIGEVHDRLENMLQFAYHTTGLGGISQAGVANDTATYAQIADSNSDAIFSPVLSLKAMCNLETVKKGFYKFVQYTPFARFIPFKTPKGASVGMEISGKELDGEYQWTYIQGSEAPKTRFTELQKKSMFFREFGGVMGYLQAVETNPQKVAEIEKDYDVNFGTDNSDLLGENCRRRFEYAKTIARRQFNDFGAVDFMQTISQIKPSLLITEPNLTEKALWFQNLLDSEEGTAMNNEQRELVSALVLAFRALAKGQTIEIQREQAEIQIVAQQPIVDAQNAQEQQKLIAQSAMQSEAQNAERQAAGEETALAVLDRAAGMDERAMERQAQSAESQADRQRDVMVAQLNAQEKQV